MKEKCRVLCNGITKGLRIVGGVRKSWYEEAMLKLISRKGTGVKETWHGREEDLWERHGVRKSFSQPRK